MKFKIILLASIIFAAVLIITSVFKIETPIVGKIILKECPYQCCGYNFDFFNVKNCPVDYTCLNYTCIEADSDNDGLTNIKEKTETRTDPYNPDSDGDWLNDGDEVKIYRTNPLKSNSDCDRYSDYDEISRGSDPNTPNTAKITVTISERRGEYNTFNIIKDGIITLGVGGVLGVCIGGSFGTCAEASPTVAAFLSSMLEDVIYTSSVDVTFCNEGDDYTDRLSYDVSYYVDNEFLKKETTNEGRISPYYCLNKTHSHEIRIKDIPASIWNFIVGKNKPIIKIENVLYDKYPIAC